MQLFDSFCKLLFSTLSASWVIWYAGSFAAGCKVLVFDNQLHLLCSLLKLQSLSDDAGIAASCCCSGCMIGSWLNHLHGKWCSQMAVSATGDIMGPAKIGSLTDDKDWC